MTSVIIVKSVILFKRDAVRDKQVSHSSRMPHLQPDWQPDPMGKAELHRGLQEFNMFLERMLKRSPIKSLIVYPEGEVELTSGAYSPHFRLSTRCRPDPAHLLLKHAAWPPMTDPGRDLCMPSRCILFGPVLPPHCRALCAVCQIQHSFGPSLVSACVPLCHKQLLSTM